jgi:hypothetical protein
MKNYRKAKCCVNCAFCLDVTKWNTLLYACNVDLDHPIKPDASFDKRRNIKNNDQYELEVEGWELSNKVEAGYVCDEFQEGEDAE